MVFRHASRLFRFGLSAALSVGLTGASVGGVLADIGTPHGAQSGQSTELLLADSGSTHQWHKKPTPKRGHVPRKSKKPLKSTKNLHKGKKNSLHSKARPKKPPQKSFGGSLTRTT